MRVARQSGRDRDDTAAALLREHLLYGELGEIQKSLKVRRYKRFEILDGHWDLPIKNVELDGK